MAGNREKGTGNSLRYVGANPSEVGVVPLPEGWPACDHEEADEGVRAEKLASGAYETQGTGNGEQGTVPAAPEE